ncbi:uncharacterized protein LOC127719524 [Mytilus californianus]|uniref:uncharacterized protein LOC127719524 n=1 Tax=Mytilus californianus TaxID=6549 RepID=UPI0022462691|nr:uncharacterized protein LOC127719524 [Mytilus californianus]
MAFPQSIRQAQVPKPCELCETDTNIKWKCVQCNTHMCEKCKKIHLKVQTSIRHDIVDAYNSVAEKDMEHTIITNNIPCQSHKKFNCMFCRTCDRFVCADCITAFHKTHDLDSIDTVCDERRQSLKQLRSRLFEKVARFETEEEQIKDLKTKYNNFLAESVEKINQQEQLIKVEVSKYANELRKQMESERQRIKNSMLEKEKQYEKNKENLLKKQSDIQEVLESEHAVNVFTAHKEFCTNEVPDVPFETLLDETKDFIPQKDNLKNISNLFGSLQKTNLPKGLSQITFDVIKSYTTNINTVEKVLILDDRTVWISNHASSCLHRISVKDWRAVAIDREGHVKWAYQGNPQVNSDKLFYPIDILTTSEGHVLVNDVITNTLHVLSGEGDLLTCHAMKDQGIFHQFSMDIDSKGQLWVGCHSESEQRSDARLHVVKMLF